MGVGWCGLCGRVCVLFRMMGWGWVSVEYLGYYVEWCCIGFGCLCCLVGVVVK